MMKRPKLQHYEENRTNSEKIADHVTSFIGSWKYIIGQTTFLILWITLNTFAIFYHVDPYPFIFLNLLLAMVGVYITPLIMMSQNRQEARNQIRDDEDLDADLKTEKYIEKIQIEMVELKKELKEIKELVVKK